MEVGREEEGRAAREAAFSLFWQEYPRKVGKQEAFSAFMDCQVEINTLLEALRRHKESEEWQRQEGRFIPNAANYLRLRRFEDRLEPPPAEQTDSRYRCDATMRRYIASLQERRGHE